MAKPRVVEVPRDTAAFDFDTWTEIRTRQVNAALDAACPADGTRLREAMRYSLLAGGKRLRPLLCLAGVEAVGGDSGCALPAASALEMLHTFSLIHDDLPAMDDDDLRRGVPTCHRRFDEATAILAGDALHTLAFYTILAGGHERSGEAAQSLAEASLAMCAGQADDLQAEGRPIDLDTLKRIHAHKTGALLSASCRIGGVLGGATPEEDRRLTHYGLQIGVAFQIIDDILDVTETSETLGKPANSDLKHDKATYPKLVGLEESRRLAHEALDSALRALSDFDERAEPLRELARRIVERNA